MIPDSVALVICLSVIFLAILVYGRKRTQCSYCSAPATHLGEGEQVCREHIHPAAAGEYEAL